MTLEQCVKIMRSAPVSLAAVGLVLRYVGPPFLATIPIEPVVNPVMATGVLGRLVWMAASRAAGRQPKSLPVMGQLVRPLRKFKRAPLAMAAAEEVAVPSAVLELVTPMAVSSRGRW